MTRVIGLIILAVIMAVSLDAQVRFQLELLPDDATYRVSMVPEVTWVFPQNLTASSQVTIRVPHTSAPYGFVVGSLQSMQPGTEWDDNVRINAPMEAPQWDYISFSLISGATSAFNYTANTAIPLFEFKNEAVSCLGEVEIIDNETDPFLPPNSLGANIAHSITTIGGGLANACWGIIGEPAVPCLPVPNCTVMGADIAVTVCENEPYFGQVFQHDTVLVSHYWGFQGCDSIVETVIKVHKTTYGNIDLVRCKGEVYQGISLDSDTLITVALQNMEGCDSMLTININVVDYYEEQQNIQLCEGSMYDGIPIQYDTALVKNLVAFSGCDSVVTTYIQVVAQLENHLDTVVCQGGQINSLAIYSDTLLIDTYISEAGCDSLVYRSVKVNDLPKPAIMLEQEDCFSKLSCNGFIECAWNTGEIASTIDINQSGQYFVIVTDAFGCTGTAEFDFQGIPNMLAEAKAVQPDCGSHKQGSIYLEDVAGGMAPYLYSINSGEDFSTVPKFKNLQGGIYEVVVEDAIGCRWTTNVQINPASYVEVVGQDYVEIKLGEYAALEIFSNFEYDSVRWSPTVGLDCPICLKTRANPLETTTYKVEVYGKNGCVLSEELTVAVNERAEVYLPNAFSPNGDGINDLFFINTDNTVASVKQFSIFDRFGGLVYSVKDALPNHPQFGWDGRRGGEVMGTGVYTYKAELIKTNGAAKIYVGSVHLIK